MIHVATPFVVPVINPTTGQKVLALLTCIFPEGKDFIVTMDGIIYHCVTNDNGFLTLTNPEKYEHETAIDASIRLAIEAGQ